MNKPGLNSVRVLLTEGSVTCCSTTSASTETSEREKEIIIKKIIYQKKDICSLIEPGETGNTLG